MEQEQGLPSGARERILETFPILRRVDFPAWIVGGAVRDLILGAAIEDVDLACVDARQHAMALARSTGAKLVDLGRERFETWRIAGRGVVCDVSELDGGTIDSDLARRDFTINAMAIDLAGFSLVDPFDGRIDLDARRIRMVREENFADDPLRTLRGVRFATTLGFDVEPETAAAMSRHAPGLEAVAPERVSAELALALAASAASRGLRIAGDLGIDRIVLGFEVDETTLEIENALDGTSDAILRWGALLRGADRAMIEAHAARWRWSRDDRDAVIALVESFRTSSDDRTPDDVALKLHRIGEETARRLVALLRAVGEIECASRFAGVIERQPHLFGIAALLDGKEIAEILGRPEGPEIGRIKGSLLDAQVTGRVRNRDEAIRWVEGHRR